MNAIRIRKENQVYSALEKKALALITLEEQKQKESSLMSTFRSALEKRLMDKEKAEAEQGASGEE